MEKSTWFKGDFRMKIFLVFSGSEYYPLGGWADFKGDFDALPDAIDALRGAADSWGHVVHSPSGKIIVDSFCDRALEKPFEWQYRSLETVTVLSADDGRDSSDCVQKATERRAVTDEEFAVILDAAIDFALKKRGLAASLKAELRPDVRATVERSLSDCAQKTTRSDPQGTFPDFSGIKHTLK